MSIAVGENLNRDIQTLNSFERLLSCTKEKLLLDSHDVAKGDFWKTFEVNVNNALLASKDIVGLNDWKIQYIGGHKFPDIVARINEKQAFGIEVKTISTRNSSWKIMGGSIMESTRIPDVSRIHVFCARQMPFEIKYRSFEECVEDVAVTHSPRYMLDMDISQNNSLFEKLGKSYDEIRHMQNPFDAFKKFIIEQRKSNLKKRKIEDDFWWYSPNSNQIDSLELEDQKFANKMVGLEMQFWNQLTKDVQRFLRAYLLVKFPSIIEGNYNDASKWLLQTQGIINPSFRDTFSAGGRKHLGGIDVPKIIFNIANWKEEIIAIFKETNLPCQNFECWKEKILSISKFSAHEKEALKMVVTEIGTRVANKSEISVGRAL